MTSQVDHDLLINLACIVFKSYQLIVAYGLFHILKKKEAEDLVLTEFYAYASHMHRFLSVCPSVRLDLTKNQTRL